jgi:Glycosyl transferases group 1
VDIPRVLADGFAMRRARSSCPHPDREWEGPRPPVVTIHLLADRVLFTAAGTTSPVSIDPPICYCIRREPRCPGILLLEVMLCGLPVLVTENCGNSVYVQRANAGLICPQPFEQRQLNDLLIQMLSPQARETWKQNAVNYCRQLDLDGPLTRTVEIIESRAEKNRLSRTTLAAFNPAADHP